MGSRRRWGGAESFSAQGVLPGEFITQGNKRPGLSLLKTYGAMMKSEAAHAEMDSHGQQ